MIKHLLNPFIWKLSPGSLHRLVPLLRTFFYSIQLHNRRIDTVGISFLDGRTDDGYYLADANVGVMFRFSPLFVDGTMNVFFVLFFSFHLEIALQQETPPLSQTDNDDN